LISVNGTESYTYNGLGDRLTQNGVQYTLDLNTGLTRVLSDGTTTYTYGLGRIAQTDTTTEYFLSDALGSVRQMTDQAGAITFAQSYDPYGTVTSTSGLSHTDYGFTGEQYSASTQMLYLRARYYNPAEGRFTSRDTWGGDVNRPLSLNRWGYVEGNPVNKFDPTGLYSREAAVAFALSHDLNDKFPDDGYYDFPTYKDNQCTMFVSSALSLGGYPTSSEWPGYEGTKIDPENYYDDYNSFYFYRSLKGQDYENAWINTPDLYDFLKSNNDELVPTTTDFSSVDWESWLQKNQSGINRGDIVFYKYEGSGLEWDHASMIVGWGSRTHYGADYEFERHTFYASIECAQNWEDLSGLNILRPLVVERSGSIQYASARSVDNTASKVEKMSIIHIR
jgi:RHS repeat-associated protein